MGRMRRPAKLLKPGWNVWRGTEENGLAEPGISPSLPPQAERPPSHECRADLQLRGRWVACFGVVALIEEGP